MLGLLLVVTMLANYLATQLPGQMAVNEGDHELQVENQLLRLGALLRSAASSGAIGAQLSQPISLGSQGEPPFAPPSSGAIGPAVAGSSMYASFTVAGPTSYTGPGNWPAGGNVGKAGGCTLTPSGSSDPTTVSCSGGASFTQNFTNGSHFITVPGGGKFNINFTSSYSTIAFSTSSGATLNSIVAGSHDNIYYNASTGGTFHITIVGNHNNITLPTSSGMSLYVTIVGNNNHLSVTAPTGITMYLSVYGSYDTASETTSSAGASIYAYFTGFDPVNVTTSNCPYGNDSSTDSITASVPDGGTFDLTYNNTGYAHTGTQSSGVTWTTTWSKVTGLTCPYFSATSLPQKTSGAPGAGFALELRNIYSPQAFLAYDQGAIVFSQPNSVPTFLVDPNVSYADAELTVWMPEFLSTVGTEVGVGTAALSVRLVSLLNYSLPSDNYELSGDTTLTVVSPYAQAWWGFFNATFPSTDAATCTSTVKNACDGPFLTSLPLGTVAVTVPATELDIQVATFGITLS